jgi:hypothetical protein
MAASAKFPMPETKKRRFNAKDITPSRTSGNGSGSGAADGRDLIVTLRRWGCSLGIFKDGSTTEPLWQLQVCHTPPQRSNAFTFQILATAREALAQHPNENVRDLKQLEDVERVLLLNGGPAMSGESDPDGVGIEDWRVVLYAAGDSPDAALEFIKFVMTYKQSRGQLVQLPKLLVAHRGEELGDLPSPWEVSPQAFCLKPFGALPPKSRRHVLCQLELKSGPDAGVDETPDSGSEDEKIYTFSTFGNIYNYRELFDAAGIQGGYAPATEGGAREYLRFVDVKDDEDGKNTLKSVLENVLCKIPVYFINATGNSKDALAQYLCEQPSVVLGEVVK